MPHTLVRARRHAREACRGTGALRRVPELRPHGRATRALVAAEARGLPGAEAPRGMTGRHGPVPARLGPVFRDRDELHAAGDLGSTITAALADSAALVVICSPAASRRSLTTTPIRASSTTGVASVASGPGVVTSDTTAPTRTHRRPRTSRSRLRMYQPPAPSAAAPASDGPTMRNSWSQSRDHTCGSPLLIAIGRTASASVSGPSSPPTHRRLARAETATSGTWCRVRRHKCTAGVSERDSPRAATPRSRIMRIAGSVAPS